MAIQKVSQAFSVDTGERCSLVVLKKKKTFFKTSENLYDYKGKNRKKDQ